MNVTPLLQRIGWCLCIVAQAASAAELSALNAAANSITTEELKAHIDVLADDSFEGREAGTRGGHAAAGYLSQHLLRRGLKPAGDSQSFYQPFGAGLRNVLALLEGSDPSAKQEVIVVGAHYDHVGYGNRRNSYGPWGYVHNGADDNASGVSGTLEAIDALLTMTPAPRRSILFAFFDGEEKGLVGSKHWTAAPTIPLSKIACMINVDMIGRMQNNRVEVFGSRSGYGLRRAISQGNQFAKLDLDFDWELKENSDHYSFFAQRIPVLMVHTGLHADYHRPSDDVHRLNLAGMQSASRLLFGLIHQLADQPNGIKFRQEIYNESPNFKASLEAPIAHVPPRLGVVSRKVDGERPGLIVDEVTRGLPASVAGIQVGDRWLTFAGHAVSDMTQFRLDILAAKSPVDVQIERRGVEQPLTVKVELAGEPVRVGLSWREDDAEPGTAIVTQVVYGSPAQVAGLIIRDRVYSVAGQRFTGSSELHKLLMASPGPIELVVERDGHLRTIELEVLPPEAM